MWGHTFVICMVVWKYGLQNTVKLDLLGSLEKFYITADATP